MGRFDPENHRGKRLAIWMVVIFIGLCIGVAYQSFTREPAEVQIMNQMPPITQEDILKAADGDPEAIKNMALFFEITEEEAQQVALQIKDQIEERARLAEREKTLGSWEDAIKTGNMVQEDPPDEDGDIARYYDVTGDGIGDFQVYYRNGEPFVWRYMDEQGEPYG